ncbi:MAG: hypothetical protein EAX96_06110 [Candidatus Lokiarchaeota archaeon]|nr:hypothetical protein [Candidatus Lokiarchaeota archaeon]
MYFLFIDINNLFGLKGKAPLLGFPVCVRGGNRDGKTLFIDSLKVGINGWQANSLNKEDLIPDHSDQGSVTLWFYQKGRIYKINRRFKRNNKRKLTTPKIILFESLEEYRLEDILAISYTEMPNFIRGVKYNEERRIKDSIPVKEELKKLKIYPEVCKYLFIDRNVKAFELSTNDGLYNAANLIVEEIKLLKEKSTIRRNQLDKQKSIIKDRLSSNKNKINELEDNLNSLINENNWKSNVIINSFTVKDLTFQVKKEKFSEFFNKIEAIKNQFNQDNKKLKELFSSFNKLSTEFHELTRIQKILQAKDDITLLQQQLNNCDLLIQYINKLKVEYQHLKLEAKDQLIENINDTQELVEIEIGDEGKLIINKNFKEQVKEFKKIHLQIKKFVDLINQINDIRLEFKEKIDFEDFSSLENLRYQYEDFQSNVKNPNSFPSELDYIPAKIVYDSDETYKIYVDLLELEDDITKIDPFINIYLSKDIQSEKKRNIQNKIIDRIRHKLSLLRDCETKYSEYRSIYEKYPKYWQSIDSFLSTLNTIKDSISAQLITKVTQIQNDLDNMTLFPEGFDIKFSKNDELEENFNILKNTLNNLVEKSKNKVNKLDKKLTEIRGENSSWFNFKEEITQGKTELMNEIDETLNKINETEDLDKSELGTAILIIRQEITDLRDKIIILKVYFETYKNFILKIAEWTKNQENNIIELSNNYYILKELYEDVLPFTEGVLLKSIIDTVQTDSILEDILESIKSQTERMYYAIYGDNRLTVEIDDISKGTFYVLEHHKKKGRISNPSGSETPTLSFGIIYSLAKKFDLPILLDETIDGFDTSHTNIVIDEINKLSKNNNLQFIMVIKDNQEISSDHSIYQDSLIITMKDSIINWE